ncbi:MAG: hypothetical protein M3Q55_13335 [Acidobacteriota bacterium]|nr:hypothetical protein [Acidobacteriota bacterium]
MARGWESKNIESQQEEALKPRDERPALTPDERDRLQKQRAIELALAAKRVELANAVSAGHRAYLERAIADLERLSIPDS